MVAIHLTPDIFVDSVYISFYPNTQSIINRIIKDVKFKMPIVKKELLTREDSIAYSDSLFSNGMYLYNKEMYQESITLFEKCSQ